MKRYIRAGIFDSINQAADELKQIISDALAEYGVEFVNCYVDYNYGLRNIEVKYQGQPYTVKYEGNIKWDDDITSVDDYMNTEKFEIALASVFFPFFKDDQTLIHDIQEQLTDTFNSIVLDDGTYVECDFTDGAVYGFSYRPDQGVTMFPSQWHYYSPEGAILNNGGYIGLRKGNICITFSLDEVYDLVTAGVDAVDLEAKVKSYFDKLNAYYYEKKPAVTDQTNRAIAANANFKQLKEYLESRFLKYNVEVRRTGPSSNFIEISYDVDGYSNTYNPQYTVSDLADMDEAFIKHAAKLVQKAISKFKNSY